MTGHVFVTRGDITRIAVDAWLLPSDAACHVTAGWHASVPALAPLRRSAGDEHLQVPTPEGWRREERVLKLPPAAGGSAGIWLGNVGSWAGEEPAWFADAARQFVRAAAADGASGARHGRAKPLVALPLIGTGQGGGNQIKGDVLTAVIEALEETVARHDVDAVLVTASDAAHAAAQTIRLRRGVGRSWQEIAPLVEDAERLAGLARAGRLVLFIGAGIGKGAGLPDWNELLEGLREQAGVEKADWERTGSVLDRARLIQVRLGGPQALEQAIAERFGGDVVSLSHTLLAALPVREAATTNYDRLFELAAKACGRPAAALPYEAAAAHDGRWILKMHGTITPDAGARDIVLTREDYLSYASRRAALAGIVQALLITRHMLFAGFSLNDDNFLRILHEVRNAVGDQATRPDPEPFGTALTPGRRPPDELWQGDVRWITTAAHDNAERAPSARRLELFLDLLLALATDTDGYLLREDFASVLDDGTRRLAAILRGLEQDLDDPELAGLREAEAVRLLLARLGGRPAVARRDA